MKTWKEIKVLTVFVFDGVVMVDIFLLPIFYIFVLTRLLKKKIINKFMNK